MGWRLRLIGVGVLCAGVAVSAQGDARAAYARAVALEAEGNHAAALSLLWEAAGLAPRDPEIQNRLGEALERIGALDAAIDAFRVAVADRPSDRKAHNNLVLTLVKAGQGGEAIERARLRVAASPQDPDAHFTLGLAQADQDVEGAIETFRRVLALDSRHALARYNLALVLKRADRFHDAAAELTQAIRLDPKAEAYYAIGVLYWHEGQLERAARALRQAIAREETSAHAHATLGAVLRAQGDLRAAAAALRRAVALKPDLPAPHYTLAQVLQQLGDAPGAAAHFARAEALRREMALQQEAAAWTAVGAARFAGGDFLAALDLFRRATTVLDTYAPAHYQAGRALHALGEREAARSAFARAQALNSSLVAPDDAR